MKISVKLFEGEEKVTAVSLAMNHINAITSKVRSKFVTKIDYQDVAYMMKAEEAKRFLDDPDPVMNNYRFITAEIGKTAPTAFDVAQLYLHMNDMYVIAFAHLERHQIAGSL